MPDTGFLFLSLVSIGVGSLLILYPQGLLRLNESLNRTLSLLDQWLIRYRYVTALLAFIGSYAFFKLALTLPMLH